MSSNSVHTPAEESGQKPPVCEICQRTLSPADQWSFENNGAPIGAWPSCCEDCAEDASCRPCRPVPENRT